MGEENICIRCILMRAVCCVVVQYKAFMVQVKTVDNAVVYMDDMDAAEPADIDMAMEKLEKEAIEVNVRLRHFTDVVCVKNVQQFWIAQLLN